tara:strand:- start:150 stop:416 length:267 start_codon:yes stop_codon:yes gene_type:complete
MKITIKQLRDIIKEELTGDALAQTDSAGDGQMIENLRVGVIERMTAVLDELLDKSSVMGVDISDIEQSIKDCIQRIQEPPPTDPQVPR